MPQKDTVTVLPDITKESISIEVTTHCNSNCAHCFAKANRNKLSNLTYSETVDILDEAYMLGFRHLHLTGGEPLLWKPFFSLIEKAFSIGYTSTFFNTNGFLLSKEICQRLSEYKNRLRLSISLQGSEKIHDNIRGKGSFRKASRGIEHALAAEIPTMLFTTVGKTLLTELPFFIEQTYTTYPSILGISLIQLIRVENDALDLRDELLTPENFIQLVQNASLLTLYGYNITILENPLATVVAHALGMQWALETPQLYRSGKIIILADKNITLAHSTRYTLGHYYPGMLKKALTSSKYHEAVTADTRTCPNCKFYNQCLSDHMLRPSEPFRDMHPEVPYCQRVLGLLGKKP
jgi:MoaA/NifB/PqqE/SkfB family radical SAM enzyme